MRTMKIDMTKVLKRIRKAYDKKDIAVQNGDRIGMYTEPCYGHKCVLGHGLSFPENTWDLKDALVYAAFSGDEICTDLLALEGAHFDGLPVFARKFYALERKYGTAKAS